jgi:hypothetical protein
MIDAGGGGFPPAVKHGAPVSLYFKLQKDEKADLEIISAAAIAWVETLRAAAQAVDPASDVRVDLVSVDESSAIFNTLVEWFDRTTDRIAEGYERTPRGRKLALALALFTITTAIPTYEEFFGDNFTEKDRETLDRIDKQTRDDPAVRTARQKFYRTLDREPAVVAVGIKEAPEDEPIVLVTSDTFSERDQILTMQEDVPERISQAVLEVVLVKPALVHTPRAWTFKPDGLPEFDAVMRDARVLDAIRTKGFPEQMREGIRMTVRIEVHEVMVDGHWKLIRGGRSVMRVIDPKVD